MFMHGKLDAYLFMYYFVVYHEHRHFLEFDFSPTTLRNMKIHWTAHFFHNYFFVMITVILIFALFFVNLFCESINGLCPNAESS